MNLHERRRQAHQSGRVAHTVRQLITHARRPVVDGAPREFAQHAIGKTFGQRINGHDARRVEQLIVQQLELRRRKSQPSVVFRDFAADHQLRAALDLVANIRSEPRALNRARAVADHRLEDCRAAAHAFLASRPHGPHDRDFVAVLQAVDGPEVTEIVVAAREQIQEIADGLYAQPLQFLGDGWANAADHRDG